MGGIRRKSRSVGDAARAVVYSHNFVCVFVQAYLIGINFVRQSYGVCRGGMAYILQAVTFIIGRR